MRRFVKAATVLLLIVTLQAMGADAPPTKEAIAKAVQELGDNSFDVREKAQDFLRKAGRHGEGALEEAAVKSNDPEVVRRVREILDDFKWGIYPDTDKDVLTQITLYKEGDETTKRQAADALVKMGSAGIPVLIKLSRAEPDPELRARVFHDMAAKASKDVAARMQEGKYPEVEQLLELGLLGGQDTAIRNYAALLALTGKLDDKIKLYKTLATGKNEDAVEPRILYYMCRAKGDHDGARKAVEGISKHANLFDSTLLDQGDWKELLARHKDETSCEGLGTKLAYQRLLGKDDDAKKTIEQLQKLATANDNGPANPEKVARVLLLNDRSKEAVEVLKEKGTHNAFEILATQMRYKDAFDLLEKDKDNEQAEGPRFVIDRRRIHVKVLLGDRAGADEIAKKLLEKPTSEPDEPENENDPQRLRQRLLWLAKNQEVIKTMTRSDSNDYALDLCAAVLPETKTDAETAEILEAVFAKKGKTAAAWWKAYWANSPKEDPKTGMKLLRDLMNGRITGKDLAGHLEEIDKSLGNKPSDRESGGLEMAEIALSAGDEALAKKYLDKALVWANNTTPILIKLGDLLARKKDWKAAAERYQQANQKDPKDPLPIYLRGWALTEDGKTEEGKKLMELAHLQPLGNGGERFKFAQGLSDRGRTEDAQREYDLMLQVGAVSPSPQPNRSGYGMAEEAIRMKAHLTAQRKDNKTTADLYEKFLVRCLRSGVNFIELSAYIQVPFLAHQYRACALAEQGKIDEAKKESQLALETMPGNVNLPIMLVPILEKKDKKKEADEAFNEMFKFYEKACGDHKKSAWCHNSVAWLSACCRRDLDKGLDHAKQACDLAPNHAGYMDTLAEVHFQKGDKDKAVELMKKCVELEPKNEYYKKQLKRMEGGDRMIDVPEHAQ